jgi:pimeloyl-ACP methyl ester carboxylesterase
MSRVKHTMTTTVQRRKEEPIRVDTHLVVVDANYRRNERVPPMLKLIRLFFTVFGTLFPFSAGALAERMFFRPHRHRMPARERQWISNADRVDEKIGDMTIATYRWGTGPAVLLLHGWEGRGPQMGAFVKPLVRAGYQVVAVDGPAHGESSGRETTAFVYRDVIRELDERLGGVHAIVGHSFGATCSMLAMAQGMFIERAVFVAPGVSGSTFFDGFAAIIGLPTRALAELRRRVIGRFGERAWAQFDPRRQGEALSGGSGASLVIHDTEDAEVSHQESVELAHCTPGSKLISTSGLGHRRILRDDSVVEAATAFIGPPGARSR